jgi:2,3-bisphosphoglycerate-independent phosphoglycerate mutase
MSEQKTTLLLILDGWGHKPEDYPVDKSAITLARTPFWDELVANRPHTFIHTSGNAVGLSPGIMGNSEVGHLNLGAGRVVWQEITRIDNAIEQDGLMGREAFVRAIEKARDSGHKLHLMGLVSDGGVHSMDRHYFALLRLAKKLGMPSERVIFHCFLDGRDTPPKSGIGYVRKLEETLDAENLGHIGVVSGRYFAMDRDKRWDRTQRAYDALVRGKSEIRATSGLQAVQAAYDRGENDEFVQPTVVENDGRPVGRITSGDQVIFFNFRPDRTRQLSHALVDETFDAFPRDDDLKIELTTMTRYEDGLNAKVAFPPEDITETLGEVVANAGLKQLRIAETEKYAHVTYFFSGGREKPFVGEDRILVPSPKVATYDLKPEMSLPEVSEKLEEAIRGGQYALIVSNFANGDMVGHSGDIEAAVKAAEAVDAALARVIPAITETGGRALITADHGNAEMMWNFEENCPHTQHTTTPTPFVFIDDARKEARLRDDGVLGDVAPTILQLMGLPQPKIMTGRSILA